MEALNFDGCGIKRTTPSGGYIHVAFGKITTEDNTQLEAIAFQIADHEGNIVTEFALQPDTFGVLLDTIKDLYDRSTFEEQQ